MWMPRLVIHLMPHLRYIAVQPIDALALNIEPRATVDPGSPLAKRRYRVAAVPIIEFSRQRSQRI